MLSTFLLGVEYMFIGRKNELGQIKTKLESNSFELGVIYGQRRIGKTSIIIESIRNCKHIYFLARDDSYQNNLRYFSEEYRKFLNLSFVPEFSSFDSLFDSILNSVNEEKLIIAIDELPFLVDSYPGFISYLQGFSDKAKRENKNIKLLLSGSNMSFMMDLLTNKAKPLYQRATFKLFVKPMKFSDANEMLLGLTNIDKAKYLSIFGNSPYYLEKIDKKKSFKENIVSLCFNSSSILIDAPNMTLPLGFATNSTYISILVAISSGRKKVKEMSDLLKLESNALATYLKRMSETGAIEKRMAFNGNQKSIYYEISDPFIRFYYKFIYQNIQDIERNLGTFVYQSALPSIEEFINHGFEDVTISYLDEKNEDGLLPDIFHPFKNYKVDNSQLGRSVEIDIISDSVDGKSLLAGEVKFRNKDISIEKLEHLKENVSIFANKYQTIYYFLFSKSSFSDDLLNLNDSHVKLFSLDEMMRKGSLS